MQYLQKSFSVGGYQPNPDMCCDGCVFGTGDHAWWCEKGWEVPADAKPKDKRVPLCIRCGNIVNVAGQCEYCMKGRQ